MYHAMYQPCTSIHVPCTKLCINQALKPVPYHVSTMYHIMHQNMYHTINHVPYHASKHVSYHQPCTMRCASTIYHITHDMSQSSHTPCTMKCLNKVPKHVPTSLTNASNHVPYHQLYTSNNMPIIHIPCTSNMCHITHYLPEKITKRYMINHAP
jgi:hypothetical protein